MKAFSLAVAQPCHEGWEEMTPEELGRFCSACRKTVVDFSVMSDRQLAEYFSGNRGSLCGRFHTDQLNRPIMAPPKPVPWMRPLVPLALSAMTLLLEACSPENEVTGSVVVSENVAGAEPGMEQEQMVVGDTIVIQPVDTIKPSENDIKPQVLTEKRKGVHPSFFPVDTVRLPPIDTATKRADTAVSDQKPLLHPKKESLIMGMVVNTYYKAKEAQRKEAAGKES